MKKKILIILILFCSIGVFGQTQQRPKLPVEYFAEYNIDDDEFGKSHDNDKSSLYTFYEAKQICPKGWHLPTQEEWAGIFPYGGDMSICHRGFEPIDINGVTKNYFAEYKEISGIKYAIRLKRDPEMQQDNRLLSAYRYEFIGDTVLNGDNELSSKNYSDGTAFKGDLRNIVVTGP